MPKVREGGNVIRRIRKEILQISQADLARRIGVNQGTLTKWEHPDYSPPLKLLRVLREAAIVDGRPWRDSILWEDGSVDRLQHKHPARGRPRLRPAIKVEIH